MLVHEMHRGATAGGEAQKVHLTQGKLVDEAVGVLYDVLRLQGVVGQTAGAPATAAEVEEDDVVVAGEWLEPRHEVSVPDIRSAVHDDEGRLVAAYAELTHVQRDITEVNEHSG